MTLTKNQIRSLVLWVHPGHQPVTDEVLDSWRNMINVLEYEPRVALLETSNASNSANHLARHPEDRNVYWFTRQPYGEVEHLEGSHEREVKHQKEISKLERLAKQFLGDRFHVWPHGNFLENNFYHLKYLQDTFNIESRVLIPGRPEVLFATIACYGLKPDACVEWQMYDMGIRSLTHKIIGGSEHPDNGLNTFVLYPQLDENYRSVYPAYVEGVPSTKESFRELIKQRVYGDYPLDSTMIRELPSADSEEAKGIIIYPWKEKRPEIDRAREQQEEIKREIFSDAK